MINVDGLDSDRRKWNRLAKSYLRAAERLSPRMATRAITDSHAVAAIYERRYGREIGVVPYGAELPHRDGQRRARRLGLEPRRYVLFVGRLEPENNPHLLVEAWARIPSEHTRGMKLVVVGGAPYASEYINRVRRAADPRVVFPGYVFGPGYWELQRNAYLFCAPTEVGGTHPVILESLVAGNCVLVNDYRPNAETVGDAGVYFSGAEGVPDLARQLERLLADPELVDGYREKARERAKLYSWDAVAAAYEQLLLEVSESSGHGPLPMEKLDELERATAPASRSLPPSPRRSEAARRPRAAIAAALELVGLAGVRVHAEGADRRLHGTVGQVQLVQLEAPEAQPGLGVARMLEHRLLEASVGVRRAALASSTSARMYSGSAEYGSISRARSVSCGAAAFCPPS